MDIQSVIREAGPVANALNVFVLALGYYFLVKLYRGSLHERQRERIAGGRPQVVVATDYSHLPEVSIVVHNFTEAPTKDIEFDFSSPVEDSNGLVLSNLPFFKEGLPFLQPGGKVSCRWDSLLSLIPLLKAKGLEDGVSVTTRYKDLAEESYETEWKIHPLLFEGAPIENSKDMNDLVNAVEKIRDDVERDERRRTVTSSGEG